MRPMLPPDQHLAAVHDRIARQQAATRQAYHRAQAAHAPQRAALNAARAALAQRRRLPIGAHEETA